MKLQTHYNKISITATIFVLLITAVAYYLLLDKILKDQLDDALAVEEAEIYDYIKKHDSLPDESFYDDQQTFFLKKAGPPFRKFSTLTAFYQQDKEYERTRQLAFTLTVHQEQYIATIQKSTGSVRELVWLILFSTMPILLLLLLSMFFINRFLVKKLWQPFYTTLSSIKKFNLSAPGNMATQTTDITEFRELNEAVRLMTDKVRKDYKSLRSFTDNASHEIQTPLAIIHSKLDMLVQQAELKEESMELIDKIYASVEKLSGITQKLLLLTKIEQRQFSQQEAVSISRIVKEKVAEMQDQLKPVQLDVVVNETDGLVQMDKDLAAILVGNLLRNAVQHSAPGTAITVETGADRLTVLNGGTKALDGNRVFNRFSKSGDSDGHGLGLSIVAQICEQYGFQYSYEFRESKHIFSVRFR